MTHHTPPHHPISLLAHTLDRDIDDLRDAIGTGDAVVRYNDAQTTIIGFAYAQIISRVRDRGLRELHKYRVIDTVWLNADFDPMEANVLRAAMLRELLDRLRTKIVLLHDDLVQLVPTCETVHIGDIDIRARYRVMDALGIRRTSALEHCAANERIVGIIHPTQDEVRAYAQVRIVFGKPPDARELRDL